MAEKLPKEISDKVKSSEHVSPEDMITWQRALYEKGWLAINWPKEYGGRGAPRSEQLVYYEEPPLEPPPLWLLKSLAVPPPGGVQPWEPW